MWLSGRALARHVRGSLSSILSTANSTMAKATKQKQMFYYMIQKQTTGKDTIRMITKWALGYRMLHEMYIFLYLQTYISLRNFLLQNLWLSETMHNSNLLLPLTNHWKSVVRKAHIMHQAGSRPQLSLCLTFQRSRNWEMIAFLNTNIYVSIWSFKTNLLLSMKRSSPKDLASLT